MIHNLKIMTATRGGTLLFVHSFLSNNIQTCLSCDLPWSYYFKDPYFNVVCGTRLFSMLGHIKDTEIRSASNGQPCVSPFLTLCSLLFCLFANVIFSWNISLRKITFFIVVVLQVNSLCAQLHLCSINFWCLVSILKV